MESNEIVRRELFKVIANQMRMNKPPETRKAYERLIKMGYSELETKQLIAQCLSIEIFNALKHGEDYNQKRYTTNLNNLPTSPLEGEGDE
jgi:hypothetical protein